MNNRRIVYLCTKCKYRTCPSYCECCNGGDKFIEGEPEKVYMAIARGDGTADMQIEMYQRLLDPYHNVTPGPMRIANVIFNDPATVVFWSDGSKTVVKCQEGDVFDPEKGLAMAITKKFFGNKGCYCNEIKKWTEPWYEENRTTHSLDPFWEDLKNRIAKNLFGSKGADVDSERDD